jgi:hypothetical protein
MLTATFTGAAPYEIAVHQDAMLCRAAIVAHRGNPAHRDERLHSPAHSVAAALVVFSADKPGKLARPE